MNLLLYPHGGSGNHGCEAIVRSTAKLSKASLVLASSATEEDLQYGLDECCTLLKDRASLNRFSLPFFLSAFRYYALKDKEAFDRLFFNPLFTALNDCDFALSIGGDNYCYGEPVFLYLINREIRKRGIQNILWGCSINPNIIDGKILADIKGYDYIIARESITYQALREKGLNQVYLYPDPAFALERKKTDLPKVFSQSPMVGVNLSPLLLSHEKRPSLVLNSIIELIRIILRKTDMSVALIPHVVWAHDDDRKPLEIVYGMFKDSERVVLIDDRPAEELKDLISRCRFMVAARTHACIAAYSSQIPTLALGYSVKANGLAKDIFGTEGHYVLPVQSLQRTEELIDAFLWLKEHESVIKEHYAAFMPDYIGQTTKMSSLLD